MDTGKYIEQIETDGLAVTQGHLMSAEDRLRRRVIIRLMGNFHILPAQIEQEFGIKFEEHFAPEILELEKFVEQGVLRHDETGWHATLEGTFVVRNMAMIFDRYLEADRNNKKRYSRTI